MTANDPMLEIEREISLAQLWLPEPDVCDIDESRMTAHLEWRNPYSDARIDATIGYASDGVSAKWITWGWPLSVVGVAHETSGQNTSNLARRLAQRWDDAEYNAIADRRFREIDSTIHSILNSPSITVQDDARSDLMGVLDDIAREHGGNYQRLGL